MKNIVTKSVILLLTVSASFLMMPKANAQFAMGVEVAGTAVCMENLQNLDGGFDLGVFFRFGKKAYLQPEVTYSFRSVDFKDIQGEFTHNYDLRQHFINIPVLLGCNVINNKNFKLRFFAGPRIGILLDNNLVNSPTDLEVINKNLQWGNQIGLGFDFWRFTVDVRYDLAADKTSTNGDYARVQNMFVGTLGFKIFR